MLSLAAPAAGRPIACVHRRRVERSFQRSPGFGSSRKTYRLMMVRFLSILEASAGTARSASVLVKAAVSLTATVTGTASAAVVLLTLRFTFGGGAGATLAPTTSITTGVGWPVEISAVFASDTTWDGGIGATDGAGNGFGAGSGLASNVGGDAVVK